MTDNLPKPQHSRPVTPEERIAYDGGRATRAAGKPNETNPYPGGVGLNDLRYWWYMGWYDEDMKHFYELETADAR